MALKLLPPKREKTVSSAEQSQRANRTVLRRTLFLMILCGVVLFIPLIFTLYRLMIVEHDKYEELAINNQTRYTNLTASRGVIYDRNMNVLATSATVETVFIDPNEIATSSQCLKWKLQVFLFPLKGKKDIMTNFFASLKENLSFVLVCLVVTAIPSRCLLRAISSSTTKIGSLPSARASSSTMEAT